MLSFINQGDFSNTIKFLTQSKNQTSKLITILNRFGADGVQALSSNTPIDSGKTSNSWYYRIESSKGQTTLSWCNSNVINGVPIAIILQYGHGTQNGGWIEGRDYINPAMQPIFDRMVDLAWKEVTMV